MTDIRVYRDALKRHDPVPPLSSLPLQVRLRQAVHCENGASSLTSNPGSRRAVEFGAAEALAAGDRRKLVDKGGRREDVAALLNVDRTTLYRALK